MIIRSKRIKGDQKMRKLHKALLIGTIFASFTSAACAEDTWTYPVRNIDPPRRVGTDDPNLPAETEFRAFDPSAVKKHSICMLLPQTQDTIFLAYMYGATAEARRLGQSLTILDAGGVENANQQRAQFDNCVTLGVNAIILESALAGGWSAQVMQAQAQGIKVIEAVEPIDSPSDGRSLGNYIQNGRLMAEEVKKNHPAGSAPVKVLILPGLAGAKFCEDTAVGVKAGLEGSSAVVLDVIYGGLDSVSQLKVVEDALVAYPDVDYILANGVAVTQAANVLRQRGLNGKVKLISSWIDPEIGKGIKSGDILGAVTESSVIITKIAVNLAISSLEGNAVQDLVPAARMVTKENIDDKSIKDANYAPENWDPVFRVE